MKKWTNEQKFCKGRSPNDQKAHEEMLNIPDHKRKCKLKPVKIPAHSY
jgi:hypothetical protein